MLPLLPLLIKTRGLAGTACAGSRQALARDIYLEPAGDARQQRRLDVAGVLALELHQRQAAHLYPNQASFSQWRSVNFVACECSALIAGAHLGRINGVLCSWF